ncbi:MAG: DUF4245 family protein [Microbacteriaceae bacterium]
MKPPTIVAELGRPETPEETAARKAETSRKHRASQTVINLVWALVASLAVLLLVVLVVVRPDPPAPDPIDYKAAAASLESTAGTKLAAPQLPPGWKSNKTEFQTVGGVRTWYVGFVTPSGQFIALNQGIDANPTWQSNQLTPPDRPGLTTTGGEQLSDTEWAVYDNRTAEDSGNYAYALSAEFDANIVVLYGTADANEFRTLAIAITEELT